MDKPRYEEASREPGVVDKLRWTTLGYHHDWDTKIYSEEKRGDFPPDLAALSVSIVSALRGDIQYNAEAAIVNYYPVHSSLSGESGSQSLSVLQCLIQVTLTTVSSTWRRPWSPSASVSRRYS